MELPRRFMLYRFDDPSGVAGVGHVADGAWFPTGWVVVAWLGRWSVAHPWPSLAYVRAIHGHHGATRIAWYDPAPDGTWAAPDGSPDDLRASEIDRLYNRRRRPGGVGGVPAALPREAECAVCGQPLRVDRFYGWIHTSGGVVCPAPFTGVAAQLIRR